MGSPIRVMTENQADELIENLKESDGLWLFKKWNFGESGLDVFYERLKMYDLILLQEFSHDNDVRFILNAAEGPLIKVNFQYKMTFD